MKWNLLVFCGRLAMVILLRESRQIRTILEQAVLDILTPSHMVLVTVNLGLSWTMSYCSP